jgi:predicted AAA+ superfamily ATPase
MVEVVRPCVSNLGKRLVKAPKIYLADSGITTALLHLESFEATTGHPVFGSLWEQVVLANLKGLFPRAEFFFYRTSNGAEIDFVMSYKGAHYALECKASSSPSLTKGNFQAFDDIKAKKSFIVAPVSERWKMRPDIEVISLNDLPGLMG